MAVNPEAIAGFVQGGAKLFQGIRQGRKAKKLKESTFIPPALLQQEAMDRNDMNATRYAGQDVDEANIESASVRAMSNINKATTSSANAINAGSATVANEQNQKQQLSRVLQQFKERGRLRFRNTLGQKADQQLRNRQQYEAAKSSLKAARDQNIFGGVMDLAGAVTSMAGGKGGAPKTQAGGSGIISGFNMAQ